MSVSQGSKSPVAIRITRPYATEDEFLAHELDTVTKSGVTLVGAQVRPEGVVLRFEITLADGTPILRGEGRVVGYKATAHGSEPGLALRFTRLDSKSKALVDRAAALRDARAGRPSRIPPTPVSAPELVPVAQDSGPISDPQPPVNVHVPEAPPSEAAEPDPTPPGSPPVPASVRRPPPPVVEALSGDRDAVLERLRTRAAALAPSQIDALLLEGRTRARK